MPAPTQKVEIGFNLTESAVFFRLDDAVRGVLDSPSYVLGGNIFYDVTSDVKAISYRRGKNRFDDSYAAGGCAITLDNQDRKYDPTFTSSPYYGQIIPKRAIRISTNGSVQFSGWIDDWNLSYAPGNDSVASATGSDGFGSFANQTLPAGTAVAQLPGARINTVLDSPDVAWDASKRSIDTGLTQLGADVIAADTNVLSYLQRIEQTEQGSLFVAKDGNLRFKQRNSVTPSSSALVFSDDDTGIKYQELEVVYGSELLFNQTVVSTVFGLTAQADAYPSQNDYGIFNLTYNDMLHANTDDVVNMAYWTVSKYNQPRYRFETLSVVLDNLSTSVQNQLLALELGDTVLVKFTPSNIPPAIAKYAEVIGISHTGSPFKSVLTFTLSTYGVGEFTLNDDNFGRLDADNGLAY